MVNIANILTFLSYGFLTDVHENNGNPLIHNELLPAIKKSSKRCSGDEECILKEGVIALKNTFTNCDGNLFIVPISGGIDSRTVLAGLIDAGYKDRIITVTFGTPGTWDYVIGSRIAKKFNLRHKVFDLTKIKVEEKLLLETAENGSSWTLIIDAFYNSLICKEFGRDAVYWTGFMGDNLAGSHLPEIPSTNWVEAKRSFANRNKFATSIEITPKNYYPEENLPLNPLIDKSIISYDDQLDIYCRQENYIKRAIIFKGYEYRTPFLDPGWINFILGVPHEYRRNTVIYKKIVNKAFPEFFKFPTANNLGGTLNISPVKLKLRKGLNQLKTIIWKKNNTIAKKIDPFWSIIGFYRKLNYVDFDEAIRTREDYKLLVYKSIKDLQKRKIIDWLDLDLIWVQHQEKILNHGEALMLLNALEISLKSENQ